MIISPARAMHHYPTREDNLLVCDSYIDATYMIVFSYPIVLIVICTVYAVLTRKIPEAFNESKHIGKQSVNYTLSIIGKNSHTIFPTGFTMYTTCVIWLAFVPLYFATANHVPLRITSMSVTISLSASVTVACLFSPKVSGKHLKQQSSLISFEHYVGVYQKFSFFVLLLFFAFDLNSHHQNLVKI